MGGGCTGVGKCVGVWGEIRKDVWEGVWRVYGVSGEVRWCVGRDVGRGMEEVC